ncbi:hypothetical protein KKC45_02680 [Patescibacteria group bacterium]|nr:hypothetical protein [Patescibacteria group bacterium]
MSKNTDKDLVVIEKIGRIDNNPILGEYQDAVMDENWQGGFCCLSHVLPSYWLHLAEHGCEDKELTEEKMNFSYRVAEGALLVPKETLINKYHVDLDPGTPDFLPICGTCFKMLMSPFFTLTFCLDCDSSQWVSRSEKDGKIRADLVYRKGCEHCLPEGRKSVIVYVYSCVDIVIKGLEMLGVPQGALESLRKIRPA